MKMNNINTLQDEGKYLTEEEEEYYYADEQERDYDYYDPMIAQQGFLPLDYKIYREEDCEEMYVYDYLDDDYYQTQEALVSAGYSEYEDDYYDERSNGYEDSGRTRRTHR